MGHRYLIMIPLLIGFGAICGGLIGGVDGSMAGMFLAGVTGITAATSLAAARWSGVYSAAVCRLVDGGAFRRISGWVIAVVVCGTLFGTLLAVLGSVGFAFAAVTDGIPDKAISEGLRGLLVGGGIGGAMGVSFGTLLSLILIALSVIAARFDRSPRAPTSHEQNGENQKQS